MFKEVNPAAQKQQEAGTPPETHWNPQKPVHLFFCSSAPHQCLLEISLLQLHRFMRIRKVRGANSLNSPTVAFAAGGNKLYKWAQSKTIQESSKQNYTSELKAVHMYIYIYVLLDPAKASPFYPCGVKIATVGMLGEFNSPAPTELDDPERHRDQWWVQVIPHVLHAPQKKRFGCSR